MQFHFDVKSPGTHGPNTEGEGEENLTKLNYSLFCLRYSHRSLSIAEMLQRLLLCFGKGDCHWGVFLVLLKPLPSAFSVKTYKCVYLPCIPFQSFISHSPEVTALLLCYGKQTFGLSVLEAACTAANLPELSPCQDGWTKGEQPTGWGSTLWAWSQLCVLPGGQQGQGCSRHCGLGWCVVWQSWQPGAAVCCPQPWRIQTQPSAETKWL